jgi:glycosyltransferase involved in cell wall biosynthesis
MPDSLEIKAPHRRVLFAMVGDVRTNSRALRQLGALGEMGLDVEVLTYGPPEPDRLAEGARLRVLPRPSGSGPAFFQQVHRQMAREALATPVEIYHASDLYVLPALAAAARRHGGRLVYDSREIYPHVAGTAGKPWARALWSAVERRQIGRADVVFTVNASIAHYLAERYGIPEPVLLHNVPPRRTVERTDYLRRHFSISPETRIVLYQGVVQSDRGHAALIEAMRSVHGAALVILGDGPVLARLKTSASGLRDRVYFHPSIPPSELLSATSSADLGVSLLEDTCLNHRLALPNKLFEYLMAGVPVMVSDLPELGGVVRRFDVGCTVDAASPPDIAAGLQAALDDETLRARWQSNAPRALDAFSWERDRLLFEQTYQKLLSEKRDPRVRS